MMAEVFYVQESSAGAEGVLGAPLGWRTFPHCFQARRDADRQKVELERGINVLTVQDGEGKLGDVTEQVVVVYRVVSARELQAEGDEALREARDATAHRPEGFPVGSGDVVGELESD